MKCEDCGMCCYIPRIEELNKPHYVLCKHYIDDKCEIYEDRPEECRLFECIYYQTQKCSENLRPDICGVMLERLSESLILGSIDDEATMLGIDIKQQIQIFVQEGISVVLQHKDIPNPYIFYTEDRTAEDVFEEFEKIRYGKS
jgi:Fe-S-cluster containining protein